MSGYRDILYGVEAAVASVTLNRPAYKNAQSWRMLDGIDAAFDAAAADPAVRVIVVRGSGGHFSSGHDLGTPEQAAHRQALGPPSPLEFYDRFRKYNFDLVLKWRNCPKPTIAMVEGYCVYGGWMLAAAMDVVFAADDAQFLAGFVEYMSAPWDIGVRRAKELCFESRFISAAEAAQFGLVNRVVPQAALEQETFGYARRVAENDPLVLRLAKLQMNKAEDAQGFSRAVEDSLGDFVALINMPGAALRADGQNRLSAVDLAIRGRAGRRPGQPNDAEAP
jgi:enoyl-CoA hydratase